MRSKTASKILSETSEEKKEKVRNNANNLIKNAIMKNLLESFLENHLDKHTYPMLAELAKNVMSVHQREIRSVILLNINGVKLEDNMTFTLESKYNKDYSHLIDVSEILDCSEEMFKNYLEEFKSTEKENYIKTDKNYYQEINDIVHENQGNLGDITNEIYQWFKGIIKIQ